MPKEKVPIAKSGSSSTTERLKEWSCKPNTKKEEKKVLQELAQSLERIFVKQNECVITPKEEHNSRTLTWRQTLGSDEAWGGQAVDAKNESIDINISQDDL